MIDSAETLAGSAAWAEDLGYQAVRGYEIAKDQCSCEYPYHAIWGILRAANVTGSLRFEEEALGPLIGSLVKDGSRIMIAGSADTGTPCVVGRFARAQDFDITVVDRCPAPLKLIDEISAARGFPFRTAHSDLLKIEMEDEFDVVLINYTLNYILPAARPALFKRLAHALKPGGTLICAAITRVGAVAADTKSKEVWIENAFKKIKTASFDLPLSDDDLLKLLHFGGESRVYRRQLRPTLDEIKNCITGAGLQLAEETKTSRERDMNADGMRPVELEPSVILSAQRPL